MQIICVVIPLIAGIDKFFNFLTFWPQYFPENVTSLLILSPQQASYMSGIFEIFAGIVAYAKPKIGALIVAGMYAGIILTLLMQWKYFNIILIDTGLLVATLAFWILANERKS